MTEGATSVFVEVAVPVPVAGTFHYRARGDVAVGSRVLVPFGGRKLSGVVVRSGGAPPDGVDRVLDVAELLDAASAIPRELVDLCLWIADYYEAPIGEVLRAALPAGTQVDEAPAATLTEAGRRVVSGAAEAGALPRKHRDLLARLARGAVRPGALPRGELDALIAAGLVQIGDRRRTRVRPRRVRLARLLVDADPARQALARAARQRAIVDAIVAAGGEVDAASIGAPAALRELVARGVVEIIEREVVAGPAVAGDSLPAARVAPTLTGEQAGALAAIAGAVGGGFSPFLLHGVTGSGKTEVYLHAIATALDRGGTALVLVPEISLTPQLAARFRARFGDQVAVLHSGLTDRDRLGEWQRLRRGDARIALGARSAVFAPIEHLAIVVVDEEHDPSFKQDDGVRYHGRDVALVRAQRAGAVCVLGSATPSVESFAAAAAGRYQLVAMPERVHGRAADGSQAVRPLPAVEIIDLKVHRADGEAMLSAPLAQAIAATVEAGDQVILFLNRRGYATFVLCRACGHAFRCPHCSVSLTFHLQSDRMHCHYCGYARRVPEACAACGTTGAIERRGLGTERVAAEVAARFAPARVARLDRDVATGAKVEHVLAKVARREVDILVGTQMVTKGHDFPGVTLVGVLCADVGLSMPDFRASERTFQLLTQVAGRAGCGDRPGRAIIQTFRPDAAAVVCAARHDYAGFFAAEMEARAELGYPPHGRLAAIRVDGADAARVGDEARRLGALALALTRAGGEVDVRGPVEAPLARLRGRTRWQLWLRGTDRAALRRVVRGLAAAEVGSGIRVAVDVDPVSAM
jgi:primosomal protein N' (replication factor Y) (superfamily II helicase)